MTELIIQISTFILSPLLLMQLALTTMVLSGGGGGGLFEGFVPSYISGLKLVGIS